MTADRPLIVALGEVLWDLLPGGKQLGGAPANFAYHAAQLGADARIVSAVGDDALGREILDRLTGLGLDTSLVAVDPHHPTGTVGVSLEAGQPTYTIHEGVAWDFIPTTPELLEVVGRADCVCFGTLAQRSMVSRDTIWAALGRARRATTRLLDINFRQHYYERDIVGWSVSRADVLKLNDHELPILGELLSVPEHDPARQARSLVDYLAGAPGVVAVTRGDRGSLLSVGREGEDDEEHPGYPVRPGMLADAVGAGDAFTAALAVGLLKGLPLARINDNANRLAAYVCTQPGATPAIPAELLRELA